MLEEDLLLIRAGKNWKKSFTAENKAKQIKSLSQIIFISPVFIALPKLIGRLFQA